MKKQILLILVLVLTAAMLTACGCTDQDAMYTTQPTTKPTMSTTAPTTQPATNPSTQATTQPTIDRGNGSLEEGGTMPNTTGSTTQTEESRAGQTPKMK